MKKKWMLLPLLVLWLALTAALWLSPPDQTSVAERRPLAQFPAFTGKALLSGSFMKDFESYTLDQFPLRDGFRTVKSLFHYYVLRQSDNNGIYLAEGMAAQQEYPMNGDSLSHAAQRFQSLYDNYLTGSKAWFAVIPDKGQYLAQSGGHLALELEDMQRFFKEKLPWAEHVDLSGDLRAEDYYRTDTHWRQERLFHAAQTLCSAMGTEVPVQEDYTAAELDRPFYGVYYGQAALPMEPETMYVLHSPLLDACSVYDYETGKVGSVYDVTKLDSRDLYDVFLSGAKSLLTIENPNAASDRELILFRDSFGSSIAPLLVQGYAKVTLVDIRYIQSSMLPKFIDFHGQDVLFLYSTLVLNNSESIK